MVECLKKLGRHLMVTLKPDNLFQSFGLVLLLLASIGLISFTSKFIFGFGRMKVVNPPDQIYDPDHSRNMTRVCPFAANAYSVQYNRTVCFNRTMHHWYIPWKRHHIWRQFDEINEEKRIKRMTPVEIEENNETKPEVAENVTLPTETPSNRETKDEPSKVVCTILAALLVISSAVALCEVFRDKCMGKATPGESKQSPDVVRQEPFQSTAKVTQTLVHQTSLDRAFSRLSSEGVKPLFRRSSVPSQMMSGGVISETSFFQSPGYGQQTNPNSSPETRRKSRHFIRRH